MRRIELDQDRLPGQARLEVGRACQAAGTGPVCEESAVLATSEVVTNAMVHGRGAVTLAVDAGPDVVRVEVGDDDGPGRGAGPGDRRGPELVAGPVGSPAEAQEAEGGRGLRIVETVTSAWGSVDVPGGGTDVWFEVPVHP